MSIVNNKCKDKRLYSNHSNIWIRVGVAAINSMKIWFLKFDVLGPFCVEMEGRDSTSPSVDCCIVNGPRGRGCDILCCSYEFEGPWKTTVMELRIK
jgi:hypothetical protein